jgi:hypothetical protein
MWKIKRSEERGNVEDSYQDHARHNKSAVLETHFYTMWYKVLK